MSLQPLTWLIMSSSCNVFICPSALMAHLLTGSNPTWLIALKWLSWVTLELHGFGLSWASLRGRSLALSSTSCSMLIYHLYWLNISQKVICMLMMSNLLFVVYHQTQTHLAERINSVSRDLHFWVMTNRLNLNPSKTQLISFGTRQQLKKLDHKLIALTVPNFTFSSSARDLGVTLDGELSFADHIHVSLLTRSCYYQLRRLKAIRRSVSAKVFLSIVHAFLCSRIDYCNSLLIGLPKSRLAPLQTV